jgi:hypothetical protein
VTTAQTVTQASSGLSDNRCSEGSCPPAVRFGLEPQRRTRAIGAGLAIPFLLWPVYHFRNKDLVDATDVSARMIAALQRVAEENGGRTVVVLRDDRSRRASFDTALGTGLQEAVDLLVTPRLLVWMDPPPADAELGGISRAPAHADVTLRLSGGQVVREQ